MAWGPLLTWTCILLLFQHHEETVKTNPCTFFYKKHSQTAALCIRVSGPSDYFSVPLKTLGNPGCNRSCRHASASTSLWICGCFLTSWIQKERKLSRHSQPRRMSFPVLFCSFDTTVAYTLAQKTDFFSDAIEGFDCLIWVGAKALLSHQWRRLKVSRKARAFQECCPSNSPAQ